MADKIKKPVPTVCVSTAIGLVDFEISAESGEATLYSVSRYLSEDHLENGEPFGEVSVTREDFLAMLEVARLDAAKGAR